MARIDDVAKAAGVSISTVSYALSGKRPISPDTRRRVEEAIRAVGYEPNAGARMLAARRTQILALTEPFRPDTHAPTHMAFVLATSIAARRFSYDILLLTDAEASEGMRRVASSRLVDAIIALDVAPDDVRVPLSRSLDVPTVFVGVPDDHAGLTCVDFDFEGAAALAVDRLADAGHEHVGLLGHPAATYRVSNFPPRARAGFSDRAEQRGLTHVERPISDTARHELAQLLDSGITGLVLQSTHEAHREVLDELARLSIRIPEDISVVSVGPTFDVDAFDTPLDSIPLHPEPSCDMAVELAAELASGAAVNPGIRLITPEYRARGSVARPAQTGRHRG